MGLRDRRNERKEERQSSDGGAPTRFQMRQKLLSIGDDFWVENEDSDSTASRSPKGRTRHLCWP